MSRHSDIPIEVILSLYTRRAFVEGFWPIHEAAEWVLGHPIWTHEFAELALWDRIAAALKEHLPWLEDAVPPVEVDELRGAAYIEAIQPWIAALREKHGATFHIPHGKQDRQESPVELNEFAPGKPVLVIVKGGDDGAR